MAVLVSELSQNGLISYSFKRNVSGVFSSCRMDHWKQCFYHLEAYRYRPMAGSVLKPSFYCHVLIPFT